MRALAVPRCPVGANDGIRVVRGLDPDRLAFLIRLSFAINCKNRAHDCSAELVRFAVDCKLSVLRHVSEDTS